MNNLFTLRNVALVASLMTFSFASLATGTTDWDFRTSGGNSYGSGSGTDSYGNTLSFNSADTDLTITAWADTLEQNDPDTIQTATAAHNSYGLLNYNRNNDGHYVDNRDDTDMLLFTFDDLVSITGVNIGYYSNDSDISIAAFDTLPTLQGQTWATVASAASYSASFSNLSRNWNSLASATAGIDSKYWVIGAYNGAFGSPGWSTGNDNLRIAGISTIAGASPKPPTSDVAEPSSLAILASFGLFAVWRRRKSA